MGAATSLGGFIGPLGGSSLAASVDIRYVFLASGLLMLVVGAWVARAVRGADLGDGTPQPARRTATR